MTFRALPQRDSSRLWLGILGVAVLIGAWLRLGQIAQQVLIDDEWHAVHQVLTHSPREMFVDFGYADYSIPLGLLDWYQAQAFGLSELALRWPMIVCGLATLVVLPLYVMRRQGRATAAVFALLLAISPLLVIFTRMARPYAITLLLGWIAHAAFQRYFANTTNSAHAAGNAADKAPARAVTRGEWAAGATCAVAMALATWLHPIAGPFAVAPLLWGLAQLPRVPAAQRHAVFMRWLRLALAAGALTAALVLPPLLAHPMSLVAKGGADAPDMGTLVGVWYAWFGTPSTAVIALCVMLAAVGAPVVWREMPVARSGTLGLVLTFVLVSAARPTWSQLPVTMARYLLPAVPLLLLFVAAGTVRIARNVASPPTRLRRTLSLLAMALPVAALAAQSPLSFLLREPNGQTQHLVNYLDFRPEVNPYMRQFAGIPLSPFWATLASRPAGSVRIAAAPFYFESFNWDAPRWEQLSHQTVLPGWLTGLCVDFRGGELPRNDPRFRFANAVHLADDAALAAQRIDYVTWQKPYMQNVDGRHTPIGGDTAACERVLREKFGAPAYEDSHIIVFPVSIPHRNPSAPHAAG